ncbi:hypothetical protein D3C77_774190 [compost metagenome]
MIGRDLLHVVASASAEQDGKRHAGLHQLYVDLIAVADLYVLLNHLDRIGNALETHHQ